MAISLASDEGGRAGSCFQPMRPLRTATRGSDKEWKTSTNSRSTTHSPNKIGDDLTKEQLAEVARRMLSATRCRLSSHGSVISLDLIFLKLFSIKLRLLRLLTGLFSRSHEDMPRRRDRRVLRRRAVSVVKRHAWRAKKKGRPSKQIA